MSFEVPPKEEEAEPSADSLDPGVNELLRRLLTGELELKVDPLSGRALIDGNTPPDKTPPSEDRP